MARLPCDCGGCPRCGVYFEEDIEAAEAREDELLEVGLYELERDPLEESGFLL